MARIAIIAGLAQSLVNFRGPLIEAMLADGHLVHALGPEADRKTLDWLAERSVAFHEIPLSRAGLSPIQDLATFRAIQALLERIKPDIAMAYTIKAVIYGMLAARRVGVPRRCAMITGLGYAFTEAESTIKRQAVSAVARHLYRKALAHADSVAFQNPDDRAIFESLGLLAPGSVIGIVNGSGVDTTHFGSVPLPAEPRCLMISRLLADKGVGEYLAAAAIVRAKRPGMHCVLVGPRDPNPAALPSGLLEDAVGQGIIDYQGELADVRSAIAGSSIYVLPSYREGTPRSVLEAMAMGRPVVTTDAPGCRETVQDGVNGFLVPVKSAERLADAILTLADSAELRSRMGQAGRKIAVERYDACAVARSVLSLFRIQAEPERRRKEKPKSS